MAEISISIGIVIAVFIPVIIAILVEKKKINSIRVGQVWFTEKHFNPFLRHKRRVRGYIRWLGKTRRSKLLRC